LLACEADEGDVLHSVRTQLHMRCFPRFSSYSEQKKIKKSQLKGLRAMDPCFLTHFDLA